jgi:DNA-binding MarR family transcriptional regulator
MVPVGGHVRLKKAEQRFNLTARDYARLAAFRYALRSFVRFSEGAAARAGLSTQHYQAMLILRACNDGEPITINDLALQLMIKHNSAVGLVDRLVRQALVVREPSSTDRRKVELVLTPRGRQVLSKLAAMHRAELRRIGPVLERFFAEFSHGGPSAADAMSIDPSRVDDRSNSKDLPRRSRAGRQLSKGLHARR